MKKKLRYMVIILLLTFSAFTYFGTVIIGENSIFSMANEKYSLKTSDPSVNLLWNYTTQQEVRTVAISATGDLISASTYSPDGSIYLFNNTESTSKLPLWIYSTGSSAYATDISGDGSYITAVNDGQHVFMLNNSITSPKEPIWDYTTGTFMNDVAISRDGNYIVAARYDGAIILLNNSIASPKTEMWSFSTGGDVWTVAISGDGNYIATGSADDRVYLFNKNSAIPIWNYSTGGELK
jgi:WD40 repeat protein